MKIAGNITRFFLGICLCLSSITFAQTVTGSVTGNVSDNSGLMIAGATVTVMNVDTGITDTTITNGSGIYWTVRPEQFSYVRDGVPLTALSANDVVNLLLAHGSHADVVKLVTSYESTLYGIPHMRSTNGYELRRQNAAGSGMPQKLEAAAIASAIAFAQTRIAPGQSTDGALFIPLNHEIKTLAGGKLVAKVEGQTFEFNPD